MGNYMSHIQTKEGNKGAVMKDRISRGRNKVMTRSTCALSVKSIIIQVTLQPILAIILQASMRIRDTILCALHMYRKLWLEPKYNFIFNYIFLDSIRILCNKPNET